MTTKDPLALHLEILTRAWTTTARSVRIARSLAQIRTGKNKMRKMRPAMPDEAKLEPCPWCGKSDVQYLEPDNPYNPGMVICLRCVRQIRSHDAVAAWNSLPRKTGWTTYDGTESTLPPEGHPVIAILWGSKRPRRAFLVDKKGWASDPIRVVLDSICIGDRWTPWPGEE